MDRVHAPTRARVPPAPRTGATALLLNPLGWIRRITNQSPELRSHLVRYYGAYANRCRAKYRDAEGESAAPEDALEAAERRRSRANWARLLRRVFEVELTCPRCGGQMVVLSFLTDPEVVDRVLVHVREEEVELLFDPRAPPAA